MRRNPSPPPSAHPDDPHLVQRSGWLRASVLGANDGIVSISSLIVGVAAAGAEPRSVLIAGAAGLAAGAMSMAAGEYVSVSSQSDMEQADIAKERAALAAMPEAERAELAALWRRRGLSEETARQVADELTARDPLAAHVRDELGLTEVNAANPLQAAASSGATFTLSGGLPLIGAALAPAGAVVPATLAVTLAALGLLGAVGARAGGAPPLRAAARVTIWGALAVAVTAVVGRLFGAAV